MTGFLFLSWSRKLVCGVGFLSMSWLGFHIWSSIVPHLPEYLSLFDSMRQSKEWGITLLDKEALVKERLSLKKRLCDDLLTAKLNWQTALETYSWLNQNAMQPNAQFLGKVDPGEDLDALAQSLVEWSCSTDAIDSEYSQCELMQSFFEVRDRLPAIEAKMHTDLLERHHKEGVRYAP